jgi:hypothetical protein
MIGGRAQRNFGAVAQETVRDSVSTREPSKHVIEGPVLLQQEDHVFDLVASSREFVCRDYAPADPMRQKIQVRVVGVIPLRDLFVDGFVLAWVISGGESFA